MIEAINKIKKLGLVFSSYTWDASLPHFKPFNLIYGWNGCGKTTLTRLFGAIGGQPIPNLEYEIEDESGTKYKQDDPFPTRIRVFNHEYVQENIRIIEGRANAISILLGKENKDLMEEIASDKKLLGGDATDPAKQGKIVLNLEKTKERDRKTSDRDGKFTEIAKTIGAAIGGNALRDYRKPQAAKEFAQLSQKVELSEDELAKHLLAVKQESMPEIPSLSFTKTTREPNSQPLELELALNQIVGEARQLLVKTVEAEVISNLASDEKVARWIEDGFHLHEETSSNICEFCNQNIPASRLEQLAKHFSKADRQLKADLAMLIGELVGIQQDIESLAIPDKARLYAEMREGFDAQVKEYESSKRAIMINIRDLIKELKDKMAKTTEGLFSTTVLDIDALVLAKSAINDVIGAHNKKTSHFENIKTSAAQKVKAHYLGTIFNDVQSFDKDIKALGAEISLLETDIYTIRNRISDNMAKVSSHHKACEEINKNLETFLGHSELTFVPISKKESEKSADQKTAVAGYYIRRGAEPAIHLSEGEKTAIAFVYFIVHLGDQNFDVRDGIIVIDDPISSLDSNSLYQAFSFLKNAVKDGKQVFIFTHSFDFLRLLLGWRQNAPGKNHTGYYMTKNRCVGNTRLAYIDKMDKELCDYESEYHYLFKLLKQLRSAQDDSIAKAYPIPNIARKVWDTFLTFSVPDGKSMYRKMDTLKQQGYDEQKLDTIYKFTNDQSHITGAGFNPALVRETKNVVQELFDMMAKIAPVHFQIIDKATS